MGGSWFYSRMGGYRVSPKFHLFVLDVNQGNKRQDGIVIGIACTFLGDCSWEVQMQKNGVTIKGRNSL